MQLLSVLLKPLGHVEPHFVSIHSNPVEREREREKLILSLAKSYNDNEISYGVTFEQPCIY